MKFNFRRAVQSLSFLTIVIGLTLSSVGCQKKGSTVSGLLGDGLIADRPSGETGLQVFLLELKHDSLSLSSQRNAQGIVQIDDEQKTKIEKEQIEIEKELKAISSEIKILFRYKYVLNAVAIVTPMELVEKIKGLSSIQTMKASRIFPRPRAVQNLQSLKSAGSIHESLNREGAVQQGFNKDRTSVNFIAAQAAYDLGIKGQGIRVGVLDTGIDFTHSMLGGSGLVADYKAVNPDAPSSHFPNAKVVGGIDLVGTRFDSASLDSARRIPIPDANPMDENGHGTHVAGTIAGIGDGQQSYDGVAPEATVYAIKVFGSGSTSDEVVIAGLEYSIDPNLDGKFDDQLQVINLSLGGANGTPYELYNKAVTNLTRMGTFMVASAGNESDIPFIVGSPSTSDEALSVAAQIDHTDHNWRFKTLGFYVEGKKIAIAEAIESSISKPIAESEITEGEVVFGGLAAADYTPDEAAMIKGKVVLIDRGGGVPFSTKMVRGQKAGAIAVIVAQNTADAAFSMGGDDSVPILIPAVMITQEMGLKVKKELEESRVVRANLKNPEMIEKPELVGIITDFSSRGPRSYDLLIKPEITAPGQNIISASMGGGTEAVQMSGTSMSGPHMAGVMALMKQRHPLLSTRELKSVVMSTAVQIKNIKGEIDSVARQGAGQVMVSQALKTQFVTEPSAFSLGLQQIEKEKRVSSALRLKSLADDDLQIQVSLQTNSAAVSLVEQSFLLKPRGLTDIKLNWILKASAVAGLEDEISGWVVLKSGDWTQKIPFLVRLQKISQIKVTKVDLGSASSRDAEGSDVSFEFANLGPHAGDVWAFNLIGRDDQKPEDTAGLRGSECDVKAVGYRINNEKLEIGVKFYRRITSWSVCEISVMFDQDGDKKAEAELALTPISRIPGLSGDAIATSLIDSKKARSLVETAVKEAKASDKKVELNLSSAILAQDEAIAGNVRSAAILRIPLSDLKAVAGMRPRIQVLATANDSQNIEMDDYLKSSRQWFTLSLNPQDQSWKGLNSATLQGGQTQKMELTRGAASDSLLLIYPQNSMDTRGLQDSQLQILNPRYKALNP